MPRVGTIHSVLRAAYNDPSTYPLFVMVGGVVGMGLHQGLTRGYHAIRRDHSHHHFRSFEEIKPEIPVVSTSSPAAASQ